ncbi:MAG: hypothetical protein Kow0031_13100 [Anaerolineae bacterium]
MFGLDKNDELNKTPDDPDSETPSPEPAELPQADAPPLPEFAAPPSAGPSAWHDAPGSPLSDHEAPAAGYSPEPEVRPVYRVSPAEAGTPSLLRSPEELPPPAEEEADEGESGGSGWKTAWAVVREVGETVILTLIIFLLIQMVVRNFRVVGTSMVNNLQDGQYLIIDKVSYNPVLNKYLSIGGPQRGDVIVFEPPRRPDEDYVKRIIGMPGEKVQVIKGQVYINDELLEEPFAPRTGSYTMPEPVVVPEGQVFVLGDNRNNSNDSHNWGPLPVENIVGRAWISYWPPDLWGTIPRDAPTQEATLKHFVQQVIPSANASNE